ncbi:dehydrogenase/reductase SDR family member 9-like isoform X1 [Haemaphysalis longicornis]
MMHVILLNDVLLWATTSPIPWTLVLGLSICLGPTLVCCGYWLFWNIRRAFFNGLVDSDGKSVLITGCDTGFGHLLAKKLAEEGFYVYAGCLDSNSDGASCLRLVANVRVLQLDVTRDHQIDQAFELISNSDGITALWAIVANAGVGSAGKLEWYSTAEIRRLFEVNVFGVTSVVLKFLPLMKKSRGRIVIVASMFGRVTAPLMVPYCMSKYACIAFADGLRRTLYNTGVYVSTIEPTAYRTAMVESENVAKTVDQLIRNMPPEEQRQLPPNASAKLIKRARVFEGAFLRDDPSEAVKDMRAAVMETRPKAHYKTGGTIDAVTRLLNHVLPSEVADYVFHLAVNWTKPKKTSERYHNSA